MEKINADVFKAFSNKNRVQLLICLANPQSVTELLGRCDLSQSSLSQHLKILRDAGVVFCEREGKKQIYKLADKKTLNLAKQLLSLEENKNYV